MSAAVDVATYLASPGFAIGDLGTVVYYGRLPDSPATACAVLPYSGRQGDYVMEQTHVAIEYPRLQILSRAATFDEAEVIAAKAYRALDGVVNLLLGGLRYLKIMPLQPPFVLERDANDKVVLAFNVEVMRCP